MSQSDVSKAEAADQRSEQTRSFVRRVRAATRRKYTPEEKIRIVLEGFRREVTVNDLCRREGIKPHSYYSWTKEFMEAGRERLSRDTVRDATRQEIQDLKRENGELKQLVAELSLEVYRLKKTAIPMPQNGVGTCWQSAQVGQIRTREDYYYEELRVSSLRSCCSVFAVLTSGPAPPFSVGGSAPAFR